MSRSKEMPREVAEYLASVVKPRREAIGSQTDAERAWGISQSHISQVELGAGCGSAVLLKLREKLDLSLEELCFPSSKRKRPKEETATQPPPPTLDLDAVREMLRAELANASKPATEPPPINSPPKRQPESSRPRRR